jgi:rubredoxin
LKSLKSDEKCAISSAKIHPMEKYECMLCEYIYNPERGDPKNGIAPGTPWEALPDDWFCPKCGTIKENFFPLD